MILFFRFCISFSLSFALFLSHPPTRAIENMCRADNRHRGRSYNAGSHNGLSSDNIMFSFGFFFSSPLLLLHDPTVLGTNICYKNNNKNTIYYIIIRYSIIDHGRHLISSRGTRAHHRESATTTIYRCVSLCVRNFFYSRRTRVKVPSEDRFVFQNRSAYITAFPERTFPIM